MMEDITYDEWSDIQTECNDLLEVYLEDNILLVSEVSFFSTLFCDIHSFMVLNGIQQGWCCEEDADELYEIIAGFCTEHLKCIGVPLRELSPYRVYEYKENEVKLTIAWLDNFPIQRQRTVEWHATRRQLFSASNLWKLFGTPSQYNSLIYEKCKEVKIMESQQFEGDILSPNARNWGIKYEPVSVLIYEHKYNTLINNKYGCIPHETYPIGASPDGINIKENHPKYGHLLEIKNIYNREMNGIPSKEYWIQMQIQMETCRLEYCDFLETRFKEYSKEEYEEDGTSEYKGIMLFFIPKENTTVQSQFIYVPFALENTDEWIDKKVLEMDSHILYIRTYWYLDEMFCTEIERNDIWFRSSVPKMIEGWETVLKERVDGFEHRAPQARKKKGNTFDLSVTNTSTSTNTNSGGVTIIKLDERGCELSTIHIH